MMQYSPKLKKAMAEVKSILEKHDIGGLIILHTPGFGEVAMKIDTSYSCAFFEGDTVRIRTDLAWTDDEKRQVVSDTYNMFDIFSELSKLSNRNCRQIVKLIETRYQRENDEPGKFTTNTQQNN